MSRFQFAIASVLLAAALGGCSAASANGSAPAQIVSAVCVRCHSLDRIRAARHDATAWQGTIARMRGKGAQLTDAQAQKVVAFLAGGGGAGL